MLSFSSDFDFILGLFRQSFDFCDEAVLSLLLFLFFGGGCKIAVARVLKLSSACGPSPVFGCFHKFFYEPQMHGK